MTREPHRHAEIVALARRIASDAEPFDDVDSMRLASMVVEHIEDQDARIAELEAERKELMADLERRSRKLLAGGERIAGAALAGVVMLLREREELSPPAAAPSPPGTAT